MGSTLVLLLISESIEIPDEMGSTNIIRVRTNLIVVQ